jgi:hypothetical protein
MPPLRTPSCMWDGTCVAHERWSAQGLCTPDSTRGCAHTHPWCHPTRRAGGGGHHLPGSGTSLQVLIFRIGHMVQPALHTPNLKFRFLNFLSLCIFMNKINYKTNKNKAKQCINNNVSPCICETHGKIIRHHPSSSHFHSLAATSPLCGKTHTHRGVQRGWGASIPPPPPMPHGPHLCAPPAGALLVPPTLHVQGSCHLASAHKQGTQGGVQRVRPLSLWPEPPDDLHRTGSTERPTTVTILMGKTLDSAVMTTRAEM